VERGGAARRGRAGNRDGAIIRGETRIDGRATYGHFRRFTVATSEKPKS